MSHIEDVANAQEQLKQWISKLHALEKSLDLLVNNEIKRLSKKHMTKNIFLASNGDKIKQISKVLPKI